MLLGFLSPSGTFFPCSCFEHFQKAYSILQNQYKVDEPYRPADKLCDLGWCAIQAGFIGFSGFYGQILTTAQEKWLDAHYDELDRYQKASYKNTKEISELLKERSLEYDT